MKHAHRPHRAPAQETIDAARRCVAVALIELLVVIAIIAVDPCCCCGGAGGKAEAAAAPSASRQPQGLGHRGSLSPYGHSVPPGDLSHNEPRLGTPVGRAGQSLDYPATREPSKADGGGRASRPQSTRRRPPTRTLRRPAPVVQAVYGCASVNRRTWAFLGLFTVALSPRPLLILGANKATQHRRPRQHTTDLELLLITFQTAFLPIVTGLAGRRDVRCSTPSCCPTAAACARQRPGSTVATRRRAATTCPPRAAPAASTPVLRRQRRGYRNRRPPGLVGLGTRAAAKSAPIPLWRARIEDDLANTNLGRTKPSV